MNQIKRIKRLITGKNSKPFFNTLLNLENLTSYYSLSNKDFKNGTYRIKKPGVYILSEDIVFHPNPENDCQPTENQQDEYPSTPGSPYILGFFAAITIEAHGVILDLNGYEIKQSLEHYVHQRFFSCIELASSPFFTKQGPASFNGEKDKFQNGRGILITNGKIGLSSHHAIHGNNCTNIILDNLDIYDFEICGIAINGTKHSIINNVTIRDNLKTVPLNAKYSQARFIRRHLKKNNITLNNNIAKKLLKEIENTINVAKKSAIKYLKYKIRFTNIPEIFRNTQLLSDGAVYGLVLNQNGVVVGPFLKKRVKDKGNCNIILKNITIKNIHSKPREIIGLSKNSNNKKSYSGKVMTGPFGDVFDILFNTDLDCNYIPNLLSDAQLIIAKSDNINKTNTGTTSISQKIIDWVEGKKTLVEAIEQDNPTCFVFGGDSMAHSMKGNIGLFISGGKDFYMDNISIEDIKNFSKDIGKLPDKVKVIYDKLTNLKSIIPNSLSDLGGKEYNTLITASENINFSTGGTTIINPSTLS